MDLVKHYHPKYGKIIEILKTYNGGMKLKAKFEDGKIHKVSYIELKKESNFKNKIEKESQENDIFLSRKLIESLRYGLVIEELIEKITVDRNEEIKQIHQWLSSDNPVLFLIGSYGSGKTHFLKYIMNSILLKNNWAVSFLTLDDSEIAFYLSKKFYQEVINNLYFVFNKEKYNFDFLFETLLENNSYQDHYFFKYLKKDKLNNSDLKEWIKGNLDHEDLPRLWTHQTAGNIYSYLLTSISKVLKEKFSLNGLVIIIDESENFKSSWLNYYRSKIELNFLKGFYLAIHNNKDLLNEKIKSKKENNQRFISGEKTGLIYNGLSKVKVPYLYKESFIKCIFALTGSLRVEYREDSKERIGFYSKFKNMSGYTQLKEIIVNREELGLNEIDLRSYKEIIKKISKFYIQAYQLKLNLKQYKSIVKIIKKNLQEFSEETISSKIRSQIQKFLYDLDILSYKDFYLREDL